MSKEEILKIKLESDDWSEDATIHTALKEIISIGIDDGCCEYIGCYIRRALQRYNLIDDDADSSEVNEFIQKNIMDKLYE